MINIISIETAYADSRAENANHLISGILSYTTWDNNLEQINFCVIDGVPNFMSKTIFSPPSPYIKPANIKLIYRTSEELLKTTSPQSTCHVYYFVSTADQIQQQLINVSVSKILTLSENNKDCAIGSAFCIFKAGHQYKFKVNLDSIKRSHIRINPKVLLLVEQREDLR